MRQRTDRFKTAKLKKWNAAIGFAILATIPSIAQAAPCRPGIYASNSGAFVTVGVTLPPPASGQRYLFLDGRRGATGDPNAIVRCADDVATVVSPEGKQERWLRRATLETQTNFVSHATRLGGQLIEPPGPPDPHRPLVVLLHGSEKSAAIPNIYGYMLAAQGISVFVYDKRGTGSSEGEYSQNFELLADDAVAALAEARRVAAGRFGRSGYFGGSQAGWIAPLAATHSSADFVAVGFGLTVSPIEEDREQLLDEARELHLNAAAIGQVERLSRATAALVRSHFDSGYEELARLRRELATTAWAKIIKGEYSGDMLRTSDADLRRIGRARFDNVALIWDYDAVATLRRLKVPLLWVMAGEDREAPIAKTREILRQQIAAGKPIDAYVFPDTDHSMLEFRTNPDGSRTPTRITDGYLRLLADWIKQDLNGVYGRAERVTGAKSNTP